MNAVEILICEMGFLLLLLPLHITLCFRLFLSSLSCFQDLEPSSDSVTEATFTRENVVLIIWDDLIGQAISLLSGVEPPAGLSFLQVPFIWPILVI